MWRAILALTIGLATMTGCATFTAGAPKGAVDIIAHRGASNMAPENTLAAFRLAKEMHADWFELDCTLTKDGEIIVIHDDKLDRTTSGQGRVADKTLAELKALDAGAWKNARFAGERLPTLAEALDLARGSIGVYIEIKDSDDDGPLRSSILDMTKNAPILTSPLWKKVEACIKQDGTRNLELTHKVIELVRARHMQRQVVIQSFSPIVCAIALIQAPDLRIEFLGAGDKENPERWEEYLRWGYLLDVAGFNTNTESLTPARLAAFHAGGKSVAVWTVDDEEAMRTFAGWGVDSIITNRPDVCRTVLESEGKR